jgi:hypothetical protein
MVGCGWGGSSCREAISGGRNKGYDFVQRYKGKLHRGSCDLQHNVFKTLTSDTENNLVGGEQKMRRNRRRPKLTNVRTNRDCALHLEVRIRLAPDDAPVRQSFGSCVSPGLSTVNFNMAQSVLIDERLTRERYRARNCFETLSSLVMWTNLRGSVQISASPDLNARDI